MSQRNEDKQGRVRFASDMGMSAQNQLNYNTIDPTSARDLRYMLQQNAVHQKYLDNARNHSTVNKTM